jgi:hypothetical protein
MAVSHLYTKNIYVQIQERFVAACGDENGTPPPLLNKFLSGIRATVSQKMALEAKRNPLHLGQSRRPLTTNTVKQSAVGIPGIINAHYQVTYNIIIIIPLRCTAQARYGVVPNDTVRAMLYRYRNLKFLLIFGINSRFGMCCYGHRWMYRCTGTGTE